MKTKMRDWHGVNIREETRARWVETIREQLERGDDDATFLMSGNRMVVGFRQNDGEIEIFDCVVDRIWNSAVEGKLETEQAIVENDYDDGIPFLE